MKKFLTFNLFIRTLFVLTAFVLPLVAFVVELTTHMSAKDISYNPMPTNAHIATVFLIPWIILFWGFQKIKGKDMSVPLWRVTLGMVASSSFVFAMPLVPLLPFALILTVVGIGFLPFAPLCTAMAALFGIAFGYKKAKEKAVKGDQSSRIPWGSLGLVLGFLFMLTLSFPEAQVNRAIAMAREMNDKDNRAEAVKILRTVDDKYVRQAICEYRRVRGPDPLHPFWASGLFENTHYFDSELYWSMSGKPCDPNTWGRNARLIPDRDDKEGILLQESRFDASIDAKAAIAYNEWTFTLKNNDARRREADFILQLPPDSVVSRVTLWVNGEPKEATFAGRGKATAAYEAVVRKARDPILVSEIGPDRVRVRMFPLLVDKTMKARIGITTPLHLSRDHNTMHFPKIIAGNVAPIASHRIWVESKNEIKSNLLNTKIVEGAYQIRGDIKDEEFAKTTIQSPFFSVKTLSLHSNKSAEIQRFSTQVFEEKKHFHNNLIFLIDGGIKMDSQKEALLKSIGQLESQSLVSLFLVDDRGPRKIIEKQQWSARSKSTFINALSDFEFVGGRDNISALNRVQEFSNDDNDIIIWIHASQPVAFAETLKLDTFQTPIYELQVDGDRDLNVEKLNLIGALSAIPRAGDMGSDLAAFFAFLHRPTLQRKIEFGVDSPSPKSHQTSSHLFRLAARDEVNRLIAQSQLNTLDDNLNHQEAIRLAHETQIVTRVSAAVVLETSDQYKQYGLDQATGNGVPTIPEPEEWALIIIMSLFLVAILWKRRKEDLIMEAL